MRQEATVALAADLKEAIAAAPEALRKRIRVRLRESGFPIHTTMEQDEIIADAIRAATYPKPNDVAYLYERAQHLRSDGLPGVATLLEGCAAEIEDLRAQLKEKEEE